jgi:gliding motility-associated-like protein
VIVNPEPVVGFSIASPQQCFTNNQFNFINSTTISWGTLDYLWTLGDGTTEITRDVTHSYAQPGDYTVKMLVTSDMGCADSTTTKVKVLKYAVADFFVEPVCVNLRLPLTNKTINSSGTPLNFLWDFGNGHTSTEINPVYSYPAPGTFTLKLSVNSNLCPQTITEKQQVLIIDGPAIAARYADKTAVMNFSEQLQARQIGNSVLWTPSTSLDNPGSYTPKFKGLNEQLYTIQLKTATGCVTVDTQLVRILKKIEIYVPTSFTPDGNGLNDYLRPVLMGFRSVNYFRVYNRWGKLLYQMQSDLPGWDGRINGVVQEMQTVVWMVEAVDVDGVTHQRKGTSILLR